MKRERAARSVTRALSRQAAVALIGPRQVGKTTLAHEIAQSRAAVYLDLQSPADRSRLLDAEGYLERHADKLVILDEIHRAPELFSVLRSVIDRRRRANRMSGHFLVLGSASIDLLAQSSESLAGRIEYVSLGPFDASEVHSASLPIDALWCRGGLPMSLLAHSDEDSFVFRQNFIRTYLERDISEFGFRVPAEMMRRLWTMLAHQQGTLANLARFASSLGVSAPTVARYVDLLVDLLLVRRLAPVSTNSGKRLTRSPKLYIRDCGVVHALLGIRTVEELLAHPVAGASWEGMVIESLLGAATSAVDAGFYRTSAGAEMDLVIDLGGTRGRWAIEIKHSSAPSLTKGFHHARADLKPERCFVVYGGDERFSLGAGVEAIGLVELANELAATQ